MLQFPYRNLLNAMDLDMEGNKNPEFQRDAGDGLDR